MTWTVSADWLPMRWTFSYELDADLMRYREVDDDGRLQRQIVRFGPTFDLVAATTRFTRLHARRSGYLAELARVYGDAFAVLEYPAADADAVDVSENDFEHVWATVLRRSSTTSAGADARLRVTEKGTPSRADSGASDLGGQLQ